MKPKANRKVALMDRCQTPGVAVVPLLPYLLTDRVIWEPAAGKGLMVDALRFAGLDTWATDILSGQDFFETQSRYRSIQVVTNPPYSLKYRWLQRCYDLGVPFALLCPVEMLGAKTAQKLFKRYGMEMIVLDTRINFEMPQAGFQGSGAQFPVAWFTYGLHIGREITYAEMLRENQPMLFSDEIWSMMAVAR